MAWQKLDVLGNICFTAGIDMTFSNDIADHVNSKALLTHWFNSHHSIGGSLWDCRLPWDFLGSPEADLYDLFERYAKLDFEQIFEFSKSHVFDNDMPDRELMEDATKIYFLVQEIEHNNLKFNPQIVHEPWYDRYRVHPGSGRLAAMWLSMFNNVRCLYTHFDEPGFEIPPYSTRIFDVEGVVETIIREGRNKTSNIEIYRAFPDQENKYEYTFTKKMDSEWEPERVKTDKDWEFLRYSEGKIFVKSKREWRTYAVELWDALRLQDPIGRRGLIV